VNSFEQHLERNRSINAEARRDSDKGGGQVWPGDRSGSGGDWSRVAGSAFTATPTTTSRLAMSDTSALAVGRALRYTIATVDYYGIVSAISADTYIDIMGAPLSGDVTALWHSDKKAQSFQIFIAGASFAATGADKLDTIMKAATRWPLERGYLVGYSTKLKTADTSAGPKININIAAAAVSTNDSNNGVQATASWVDNPLVAINTTNYDIDWHDALTVNCTAAAATGNAADLSVDLHFVMA
jgi:hypothetical protein